MAIEKNPNDSINQENVIEVNFAAEQVPENVNFEVDPATGEIEVDFNFYLLQNFRKFHVQ